MKLRVRKALVSCQQKWLACLLAGLGNVVISLRMKWSLFLSAWQCDFNICLYLFAEPVGRSERLPWEQGNLDSYSGPRQYLAV